MKYRTVTIIRKEKILIPDVKCRVCKKRLPKGMTSLGVHWKCVKSKK